VIPTTGAGFLHLFVKLLVLSNLTESTESLNFLIHNVEGRKKRVLLLFLMLRFSLKYDISSLEDQVWLE